LEIFFKIVLKNGIIIVFRYIIDLNYNSFYHGEKQLIQYLWHVTYTIDFQYWQ